MFFIFNYIFILLPTSLKGNLRSVLSSQAFYSVHSVTINVHCTCVIPTSQILLLSLLFTRWEKYYAFMVFYQIRFFFYGLQRTGLQIWNWCKYWFKPTRFVRRIFTYICGDYIKEHLGFLQLINFLTCRVGVGVIFIKSTKSVNFNVKNAPNGWISWCQPTNGLFEI